MDALIVLFALGFMVMLPLVILKVVLSLVLAVLLLPFKIAGGVLRLVLGVLAGVFKIVFGLGALVAAVSLLALIPLFPFVVVGAIVWALFSLLSPRPSI